jgi:alpha-ketoglutarate-dependent taurine dioxygenase
VSRLWLRDSCACPHCVDPDSGQKNFSTTDLADTPDLANAEVTPDGSLKLVWANDGPSGGASHTTIFPTQEARDLLNFQWRRGATVRKADAIPWNRSMYEALLAEERCRVSYNDWVAGGDAFWAALADLRQTGLIFVTDVPSDEKEVERIATRIGPLMHTFYGWTWDVKSKPQAENVAYTSKFLGLHQDLMYHDPIPGLQLLHCLHNSCEGGESLFSHGVRAAYEMMIGQPEAYTTLLRSRTWFGYHKGEHHHYLPRETIKTGSDGHPHETRWAPPFQVTFPPHSSRDRLREWKAAATAFQTIVESERNMVEVKLKPGECVIFENRRVLHGRRQFAVGGGGERWLKGAYVSQANYIAAATRLAEHMHTSGVESYLDPAGWKTMEMVANTMPPQVRGNPRAKGKTRRTK